MSALSDYLDPDSIAQLAAALSSVVQQPVTIIPTPPSPRSQSAASAAPPVPIRLDGQIIGTIVMGDRTDPQAPPVPVWASRFLKVTAQVISRLSAGKRELNHRVGELRSLHALAAEFAGTRDLDEILSRAAKTVVTVLGAMGCSIRLLTEDRRELLVKAVANLSPEYLNKGPILVAESQIDREVLSTGRPVYIADERTDPRVLYPVEARREGIVSALCVPMTYRDRPEGVIRLYTNRPHEFDSFEVSLVEAIARLAAAAIVDARLYEEALASAALMRQVALAAEVQRRMIPDRPPDIPGLQVAATYIPTHELSGDFFDFLDLGDGRWGIVICDVVGKGLRASLLMASVRASLRAHAAARRRPVEVVARVNADLCADALTSDFATLFYGVWDSRHRTLLYVNAGHLPPAVIRRGKLRELPVGGPIIGMDPGAAWPSGHIHLRRGDMLLLHTDGLSDAMNFRDEPFGRQRVAEAALAAVALGRDADGVVKHLIWTMRRFTGLQTRFDDLTLLAVAVV